MKKTLLFIAFHIFLPIQASEIGVLATDDSYLSRGNFKLIWETGFHSHEIENDFTQVSGEIKYRYLKSSLAIDYALRDRQKLRLSASNLSNFKGIDESGLWGDPTLSYWNRFRFDEQDSHFSSDLGVDWTIRLGNTDRLKPEQGNRFALHYRFGFGALKNRFHATYSVGIQEGMKGRDGALFYGIRLVHNHNLSDHILIGVQGRVLRFSENQYAYFYSQGEGSPSWETALSIYGKHKLTKNIECGLELATQKESSGFYRSKQLGDIEKEEQKLVFSFSFMSP